MITPSKSGTRSNRLLVIGILLITMVVAAACTSAEPTEVTRIVEVPGPEVEVTRLVEVTADPEPTSLEPDADFLPEATLPNTESWVLTSTNTGRDHRISVALPNSYENQSQSYPVLYVLDGNAFFGTMQEFFLWFPLVAGLPEAVVVGVGYDTENLDDIMEWREADFIRNDIDFLSFLRDELMPTINEEYRTNPDEATLFGHSYGGLFALYSLFQEPQVFSGYMIGSPDLSLDSKYYDDEVAYAENHSDLVAQVFMGVGAEQDVSSRNLENFARMLEDRGYENLDITTKIYEGENHQTVFYNIAFDGVRTLLD